MQMTRMTMEQARWTWATCLPCQLPRIRLPPLRTTSLRAMVAQGRRIRGRGGLRGGVAGVGGRGTGEGMRGDRGAVTGGSVVGTQGGAEEGEGEGGGTGMNGR